VNEDKKKKLVRKGRNNSETAPLFFKPETHPYSQA
jgi:hypothetical protein